MGGKRFNSTASHTITEREAARAPHISDVGALFFIAVGSFLLIVVCSGIIALIAGDDRWIIGGAVTGGLVAVAVWFFALWEYKEILWSTETKFNRDIDRDRSVGRPPPPQVITVNGNKAIRHAQEVRARQHAEDIVHFARVVWECQQNNLPTGQRALRGVQLTHSNVSDEFHRECGRLFVDNGLARADGTGWTLDATPDAVREALRAE